MFQIGEFSKIEQVSLNQIGQYLNQEISTDELRGMLALKQSQIEQQL